MGWDAYAIEPNGKDVVITRKEKRISNKRYQDAFKDAAKKVKNYANTVDGLLYRGGLDCSDCAIELEYATG